MKKPVSFQFVPTKKLHLFFAVVIIGLSCSNIFLAYQLMQIEEPHVTVSSSANPVEESYIQVQGNGLTERLLLTDLSDPSEKLMPVKNKVENYIQQQKQKGNLNEAAVYLLCQNSNEWMGINQQEPYSSTGYIRLAMLITYLKESEQNPELLNKKIWFAPVKNQGTSQNSSFVLPSGRSYSVKELLGYMIEYPDTNAKKLLADNMDVAALKKLFSDLGMTPPDLEHRKFSITAFNYSKFLRVLYNASYLSKANSEYALQLLSDDKIKKGMLQDLPPNVVVAHKLGEKFDNKQYDLRESGIIYADGDPYLLTVFETGADKQQLESSSGEISKIVYDQLGF